MILYPTGPTFAYNALAKAFAGNYTANMTSITTSGAVGFTGFSNTYMSGLGNYTARITGFFVPPISANYTFYVGGDDMADLYVSADEYAANASWAAYATYTAMTDNWYWRAYGNISQHAPARWLQAGKRYYFTSRHRQTYGYDYLFAAVCRAHLGRLNTNRILCRLCACVSVSVCLCVCVCACVGV